MKVKVKTAGTLPRNYKGFGWTSKAWEDLNGGKAIEVDSVPGEWEHLVEEVETTSTSTGSKAPSKGGKK